MLRGPWGALAGCWWGDASLLQQHITAWICSLVSSSSLLCSSGWRTRRWQRTASRKKPATSSLRLCGGPGASVAMLHARSGIFLCDTHCGSSAFARSCHVQAVSTGPWEIYTQKPGLGWSHHVCRLTGASSRRTRAHISGEVNVHVCHFK